MKTTWGELIDTFRRYFEVYEVSSRVVDLAFERNKFEMVLYGTCAALALKWWLGESGWPSLL